MKKLALVFCACIAGLTACKQESPPPPATPPKAQAPAPSPAPAPAPSPAPSASTAPISVAMISLGKALGPDKNVTSATESFNKNDTIYVAVDTTGAGNAMLKAKWTYLKGDKPTVVDESSQTIVPTGPATSEFHISKPDGWPAGEYQVEIMIDDKPAGTKKFTVS